MKKCSICNKNTKYPINTEYYKYFDEHFTSDRKREYLSKIKGHICSKCSLEFWGIKKLYHISKSPEIIKEFEFRVPQNRAKSEDSSTKRICLSENVEGALSAVPWGGSNLEDLEESEVIVYEFDVESINVSNIVTPEYLYQNNLVPDTGITREYWLTKGRTAKIKASKYYEISINNFYTDSKEEISYDDYIKAVKKKEDPSKYSKGFLREIWNVDFTILKGEELCHTK